MTLAKAFLFSAALAVAAGCASVDDVTRTVVKPVVPAEITMARDYSVTRLNVVVSRDLTVSEANLYYPLADIVWREDPYGDGDRHAQVEAIVIPAAERAVGGLRGNRDVGVLIEWQRFHALTEKARFSVGGVHSMKFRLTVYDPVTGEPIEPVRVIDADLVAYGGETALRAVRAGQTQKVRISNHLAGVIQRELIPPITIVSSERP